MTDTEVEKIIKLIENFTKVTKRILQNRPLSNNQNKIKEYIFLLCETYNSILTAVTPVEKFLLDKQTFLVNTVNKNKSKLKTCFEKLKCDLVIPCDFSLLKTEKLHCEELSGHGILKKFPSEPKLSSTIIINDSTEDLNIQSKLIKEFSTTSSYSSIDSCYELSHPFPVIMATLEEKRDFIRLCSSILRDNYNGDPLGLESFIDKLNLIENLSDESLIPTFISFIFSKLEGKARESVPPNTNSIETIKNSLRNRIKPDNSKVVAGKIASCKVKNGNFAEFAQQLESLSDAFERSLIVEGITQVKAHEMAVEEAISVCRANAKSDLVKSILASSSFKDAKDAIAKLIIEEKKEVTEAQVLNFNSFSKPNYFRSNSNRYSNPRNNSNNFYNQRNNNSYTNQNRFFNSRNYNNGRNQNNTQHVRDNTSNNNNNVHGNNHTYNNRGRNNNNNQNSQNSANVRTLNEVSHQRNTEAVEES